MDNRNGRRPIVNFAKLDSVMPMPNLLDVQLRSFEQLVDSEVPVEEMWDFGPDRVFGEIFPIPEGLHGRVTRLVGLDGKAKMSKGLDNSIELKDDAETVTKKVSRMFTDPTRIHATDPGHVEGNPVFMYHDAFNPDVDEVNDLKECYRAGTVGDVEVKQKLAKALNEFLDPIRDRRAEYEAKPQLVKEALAAGTDHARTVAAETMTEVRSALRLNYL